MTALSVSGLTFAYPGREAVLRDISFEIKAGETLVIAGLSGCGKTTLCHALCGVIPNAVKGELSGEILIGGAPAAGLTLPQIATRVGLVFQDADNQIICSTVEDELAFGLENLCVEPGEIRRRVDQELERFGLEGMALQNPATLSGGQKKLLTMAGVLILRPDILILDEPMVSLDSDCRAMVRSAIGELKSQGKTIVIVEHNLSLVRDADRWMILEGGGIKAIDSPGSLLSCPEKLREWGIMI